MEHDNKREDRPVSKNEELMEPEEFGPEDFEDEVEEEEVKASSNGSASAPTGSKPKQSLLPWLLFAASAVVIAVLLFSGKSGMEGTAAKVNGTTITKEELYQTMLEQGGGAALDNLIVEKLIAQEADKKQIQITDQDVEAELKDIKTQFPDEAQFNDALAQNNLTLDVLKEQIRKQVRMMKVFETQMDLSDAKQKEYFDKNQDRYGTPEELEISHILVEKKEDADKLLVGLKAGADFAAKAKELSTDPGSKEQGGSLGFMARNQGLDPAFEEAAFKLKKGEMSGVVQSSFGYHIIKVTDKKEAVKANFDEKKTQVKKDMVQEEMSAKAGEWIENLKKGANIEKTI